MELNFAPNPWNGNQWQQPILNDYLGERNHFVSDFAYAAVDNLDTNTENNYNSSNLYDPSNQLDFEDNEGDFEGIFNSPEKKPKLYKFESTKTIDGYSWTKKSEAENHLSAYYNCKCYRAGCKAKMIVKSDGNAVIKGVHDCKQNGSIKTATIGEIYDAGPEIKQMIQDSSIADVSKSVQSIAKRVYGEILEKHKGRPIYFLFLYY
jgi:hypothetical protein